MTEQEQKNLRAYCAFLLKEFGFDISPNDPVIPALYIMHKEMELNNKTNETIAKKVDEAVANLNPSVFNFYSGDASFKFQLGIGVKWVIGGMLVLVFLALANWHWSIRSDIEKARDIVNASGRISQLIQRVRSDNQGNLIIDFKLAQRDSISFCTDYVKVDAKTVRVYVAAKSN
jgi:hypothetical protein